MSLLDLLDDGLNAGGAYPLPHGGQAYLMVGQSAVCRGNWFTGVALLQGGAFPHTLYSVRVYLAEAFTNRNTGVAAAAPLSLAQVDPIPQVVVPRYGRLEIPVWLRPPPAYSLGRLHRLRIFVDADGRDGPDVVCAMEVFSFPPEPYVRLIRTVEELCGLRLRGLDPWAGGQGICAFLAPGDEATFLREARLRWSHEGEGFDGELELISARPARAPKFWAPFGGNRQTVPLRLDLADPAGLRARLEAVLEPYRLRAGVSRSLPLPATAPMAAASTLPRAAEGGQHRAGELPIAENSVPEVLTE